MASQDPKQVAAEAWRDWCDRLKATGEFILGEDFPQGSRGHAEGLRWLTRLVHFANRMEIEAGDPKFPRFVRYETPDSQWGGPNPDNLYLRANIDPGETYRIWADASGMRQAIFSLHEGDLQLQQVGVYSEVALDALEVAPDGRLEIQASPEPQDGNWMPMHPDARIFGIRVFLGDWERDAGPAFHIERVGAEGVPPPHAETDSLARALDRSAHWIEKSAAYWNEYTRRGWERAAPNVAAPPRSAPGGADDIRYGSCFWELGEDECLLLECEVPQAQYWGFTIHTLGWLESGDFAERQTSLSDRQVHVDADGRIRVVLAARDPGAPNWIDTEARPRGLLVYRWVWAKSTPAPTSRRLPLQQVRDALPADHPVIDEAARRRALARRRAAAWARFQ